jgi:hypothetical protein
LVLSVLGLALMSGSSVSANHPVLVEGNCDSPIPGTTIVPNGTCGDFDGDGRIGTAEDTDGADRIFGTLTAAIGPGTGAAAGTGANLNGRVVIVTSGRFAETLVLTPAGAAASGNLELEAAPGVEANIDAVLQGDPAGNNNTRQNGVGIFVDWPPSGTVTLRNLTIRNYLEAVRATNNSRVYLDNCRVQHNRDYGLRAIGGARLTVNNCQITSTGRRIPVGTASPAGPGHGISFEFLSGGMVANSIIANSVGAALSNTSGGAVRIFHLVRSDNDGGGIIGNPVIQENF